MVACVNEDSHEEANDRAVVDSEGKEVEGRTVIHGAAGDVEGEASDLLVKEETEVVTKICADETKADVGAKNKDVTDEKNNASNDVDDELDSSPVVGDLKDVLNGSEPGLVRDHLVVEIITSETNDEDEDTVHDACSLPVTTEHLFREELGLVLCTSNDVPDKRIEQHVAENKIDAGILKVHSLLELLEVQKITNLNAFHILIDIPSTQSIRKNCIKRYTKQTDKQNR